MTSPPRAESAIGGPTSRREDVWAVVSTFRPGPSAMQTVASVIDQVGGVIVVDDGSGPAAEAMLSALEQRGALVLRHPRNEGIAAALNRGTDHARACGARHVLTLDQDSEVPRGMVAALRDTLDVGGERIGAVVPEYFAEVRQARGVCRGGYAPAANVIQSGMLVPVAVIEQVGGLRSDFFIDLVDTEFELRLRRARYRVVAAEAQRLGHALGAKYRRELFGYTVRVPGVPPYITLSTPFRYFYRVRNRLVLNAEYGRVAPGQLARDSLLDAIHLVNALWVAQPRRALWRLYRAGVRAAWTGRMGRMPAALVPVAAQIVWTAPAVPDGDDG